MPKPPSHPGVRSPVATASQAPARAAGARRNLARELVDVLGDRIRHGTLEPGARLPAESGLMAEHGVSRTVVREALQRLQAQGLVRTRHGVGTFVVGPAAMAPLALAPRELATLEDIVAVLELRLALETEAAALAAARRDERRLRTMRRALADFEAAVHAGEDAVAADLRFHLEVARATGNHHFAQLMSALGAEMIPRARLTARRPRGSDERTYLLRVNSEHQSILDAIEAQDADSARAAMRIHLANSRERRRRAHQALARAAPKARA